MSHLLTSGEVGNTQTNHMKKVRDLTLEKWDKLGFLKGLNGNNKDNIAMLFENQATSLIKESTTAANSSGSFETVVFPIVRRVFSKLLANDIVSVQAMNLPIGKLFFFVPKTSSRLDADGNAVNMDRNGRTIGDVGKHTSLAADHLPDCVVGVGCEPTQYQCKNLYDTYYNDGLFDNSKGDITINVLTAKPVQFAQDGCSLIDVASGSTLPLATDGSLRYATIGTTGFDSYNKGRLTGPDGNEMDSESFLSSLKVVSNEEILDVDGNVIVAAGGVVPYRLMTQKYGKGIVAYDDICDEGGILYLELDLSHAAGYGETATKTFDGYIGAASGTTIDSDAFTISYAQYATLELSTEMGEVTFILDEVNVSVEERKLRATWSPELAQDVSAFHNIDAEAELTAMLSEQIAAEIDREILRDLRHAAAWTARWDYQGWRKTATASNAYTQKDWNQTLITKVNQISAQIYKATLRGGANFIVVSTEVSAIFNDLEYFHVTDASSEQDSYNMGIERVGSLQGRYQVYCDPYSPSDSIIVGHKGKSLLDTGYIYAPYIPLQLTPTMYNPMNFAPVKGIMTRYAKKVVNNRFYGHVKVDNVVTWDLRELR